METTARSQNNKTTKKPKRFFNSRFGFAPLLFQLFSVKFTFPAVHTAISWATFRLQYEDDDEYEFYVLSTRFRFGGRNFSKCACSELKTRTRSRPRTLIWRSLMSGPKPSGKSTAMYPRISAHIVDRSASKSTPLNSHLVLNSFI